MTTKQFEALFPLKAMITQEIISKAKPMFPRECIGALTLQSVLGEHPNKKDDHEWGWGSDRGSNSLNNKHYDIGTVENICMMRVTEPQEVTFILLNG